MKFLGIDFDFWELLRVNDRGLGFFFMKIAGVYEIGRAGVVRFEGFLWGFHGGEDERR